MIALLALLTAQADLREDSVKALRRAVEYYRSKVSVEGSYVWRYSEDLSKREGEGEATATTGWIQPPGTPTVGLAYLAAHQATGDASYLDAARQTSLALVRTQLRSGGWTHRIEFGAAERKRQAYRVDPEGPRQRNWSTLDDNSTQSALLFMARVDQALGFKDEKVHEAAIYAFEALLKAQGSNGSFPQGYEGPSTPLPVVKADYPETWSRTPPRNHDYWVFPTTNDNLFRDLVPVLLEAARIYGQQKYRAAALAAGDFLILAQMPDPQPAWAQQYDFEMRPTWARKFEPPAVTGGESQGAMETLMLLYRETADRKYLAPIPRALDYLKKSRLPGGPLARFYELRTNKPLYFTKQYELTYDDGDMPTHYAFKTSDRLDEIEREYKELAAADPATLKRREPERPRATSKLADRARDAVKALDEQGRWLETGRLKSKGYDGKILSTRTFVDNVETLARYLAATRP